LKTPENGTKNYRSARLSIALVREMLSQNIGMWHTNWTVLSITYIISRSHKH